MNKTFKTKTLVTCALLVALQIVFVRFISLGTGSIRISLGFVPVAVAGMIFGPLGGGIVASIADFLGMLLFSKGTVYFFPLTISEFLYGFGFGLFLHNRDLPPIKLSICVIVQFILVNLILSSLWLYLYYIIVVGTPKGFEAIFTGRLAAAAANLPMQIIGINVINKYLKAPLKKLGQQ